mmetsp:Transcript_23393/g.47674  ORF Transcript_23393/g.47674 Transcript_23393/m.47674 type:complete len:226 (-) Transcript_23393:72-749(-)
MQPPDCQLDDTVQLLPRAPPPSDEGIPEAPHCHGSEELASPSRMRERHGGFQRGNHLPAHDPGEGTRESAAPGSDPACGRVHGQGLLRPDQVPGREQDRPHRHRHTRADRSFPFRQDPELLQGLPECRVCVGARGAAEHGRLVLRRAAGCDGTVRDQRKANQLCRQEPGGVTGDGEWDHPPGGDGAVPVRRFRPQPAPRPHGPHPLAVLILTGSRERGRWKVMRE